MTSNEFCKKPLSLCEVVSHSNSWSLSEDSALCELLKTFSSELLTQVTQVSHNVSELQIESRQLNVVMENVSNDLCMLANGQFMENLVEEAFTEGGENGVSSVKEAAATVVLLSKEEERKINSVPAVTLAVRMGLHVLDDLFEIVDTTRLGSVSNNLLADSDHDGLAATEQSSNAVNDLYSTSIEPIYQPKDPYENRHLPHLIGSLSFIEDDTLGIGYIDDEVEEEELDKESSLSDIIDRGRDYLTSSLEGEDDEVEVNYQGEEESEDMFGDSSFRQQPVQEVSVSKEGSSNGRLNKIDSPQDPLAESLKRPLSLTEQLNKQLKAKLSVSAKPSESVTAEVEEPPRIDVRSAVSSKVAAVKSEVWSDDEDEEDIFSTDKKNKKKIQPSTTITPHTSSQTKLPIIAADDSDSDDMFKPPKSSIKPKEVVKTTPPPAAAAVVAKNIVGNSSDTEDDIFNTKPSLVTSAPIQTIRKKPVDTKVQTVQKKVTEQLSDTDDELFGLLNEKSKQPLKTAASKPIKNEEEESHLKSTKQINNTSVKAAVKPFNFSDDDDDDDEDDIFKPPVKKQQPIVVAVSQPPVVQPTLERKKDLSISSDTDSLFGSSPPSKKKQSTIASKLNEEQSKVVKETPVHRDHLSNITEEKLKVPAEISKVPIDRDSLFGDSPPPPPPHSPTLNMKKESPPPHNNNININNSKNMKETLGDNPLKNVVTPSVSSNTNSPLNNPPPKKNDKDDDDDDIFKVFAPRKQKEPLLDNRSSIVTDIPKKTLQSSPLLKRSLPSDSVQENKEIKKESFSNNTTKVIKEDIFSVEDNIYDTQTSKQTNNATVQSVDPLSSNTDSNNIRTSKVKLPPGAVSMFMGSNTSNKNGTSLLDELRKRNRQSVKPGDSDAEEQSAVVKEPRDRGDVFQPPSISMFSRREESPAEESPAVSLDTPVTAVNKLTNLTKLRAKPQRKPITKKENIPQVKEVIVEIEKEESKIKKREYSVEHSLYCHNNRSIYKFIKCNNDENFKNKKNITKTNKCKRNSLTSKKEEELDQIEPFSLNNTSKSNIKKSLRILNYIPPPNIHHKMFKYKKTITNSSSFLEMFKVSLPQVPLNKKCKKNTKFEKENKYLNINLRTKLCKKINKHNRKSTSDFLNKIITFIVPSIIDLAVGSLIFQEHNKGNINILNLLTHVIVTEVNCPTNSKTVNRLHMTSYSPSINLLDKDFMSGVIVPCIGDTVKNRGLTIFNGVTNILIPGKIANNASVTVGLKNYDELIVFQACSTIFVHISLSCVNFSLSMAMQVSVIASHTGVIVNKMGLQELEQEHWNNRPLEEVGQLSEVGKEDISLEKWSNRPLKEVGQVNETSENDISIENIDLLRCAIPFFIGRQKQLVEVKKERKYYSLEKISYYNWEKVDMFSGTNLEVVFLKSSLCLIDSKTETLEGNRKYENGYCLERISYFNWDEVDRFSGSHLGEALLQSSFCLTETLEENRKHENCIIGNVSLISKNFEYKPERYSVIGEEEEAWLSWAFSFQMAVITKIFTENPSVFNSQNAFSLFLPQISLSTVTGRISRSSSSFSETYKTVSSERRCDKETFTEFDWDIVSDKEDFIQWTLDNIEIYWKAINEIVVFLAVDCFEEVDKQQIVVDTVFCPGSRHCDLFTDLFHDFLQSEEFNSSNSSQEEHNTLINTI